MPARGDPGRFGARGSGTGAAHLRVTRPTWQIGKEKQAHDLPCACCEGLAKWDPISRRKAGSYDGAAAALVIGEMARMRHLRLSIKLRDSLVLFVLADTM